MMRMDAPTIDWQTTQAGQPEWPALAITSYGGLVRIDVWPSSSRFVTSTDWIESRHSFSYGPHYDPTNVNFGLLAVHNDDVVQPGGGFAAHPHRGFEIVTWVVSGALRHDDDSGGPGGSGVVRPGMVQCLSAGTGVVHSEVNASEGVTRYLQMWLRSDDETPPEYRLAEAPAGEGRFAVVASGNASAPDAPVRLRQPKASLLAADLRDGEVAPLPAASFTHVYVVEGAVLLGDVPLLAGDAARVIAATDLSVAADTASQVLAWSMGSQAWRPAAG